MGEPEIESRSGKEVWKEISSLSDIRKKSVSSSFRQFFGWSLLHVSLVVIACNKKKKPNLKGSFGFKTSLGQVSFESLLAGT